jgi:hypothetical protein
VEAVQYMLLSALLVGAFMKSWNLAASLLWALRHGAGYARDAEDIGPCTLPERHALLQLNGGDYLPPGAKSLRIYGLASSRPKLDQVVNIAFRNTPMFMAWCIIAILAVNLQWQTPRALVFECSLLAGWLALYALGLIVEAVLWYVTAKDYTVVWGEVKFHAPATRVQRSRALNDIIAFGTMLATSVASMAVALSTVQRHFGGLGEMSEGNDWGDEAERLVAATHYLLANLITVGDDAVKPENTPARMVATLTLLTTICIVTLVLSVISSRVGDKPS